MHYLCKYLLYNHHFKRKIIDYTVKLCEDVGYSDKISMSSGDQNITLIITQLHTIILVTLWLLLFATCIQLTITCERVCVMGDVLSEEPQT